MTTISCGKGFTVIAAGKVFSIVLAHKYSQFANEIAALEAFCLNGTVGKITFNRLMKEAQLMCFAQDTTTPHLFHSVEENGGAVTFRITFRRIRKHAAPKNINWAAMTCENDD